MSVGTGVFMAVHGFCPRHIALPSYTYRGLNDMIRVWGYTVVYLQPEPHRLMLAILQATA